MVLEELLQNSLVHFDLLHHAVIRLLIFNDRLEIINPGSLYGGLKIDGIKEGNTTQKPSGSTQKSTQITADSTQIASSDTHKSTQKASDSTQKRILEIIEETPHASRKDIAERIGISEDGVKKQLANLKRMGLIERVGAARGGYWKIIQVRVRNRMK